MNKKTISVLRTLLIAAMVVCIGSARVFAAGTENGFSSGRITVLSSSTSAVTGTASLTVSPSTCTEGGSVSFYVVKSSATSSFVGKASTNNKTATYTFETVSGSAITIDGTRYSSSSASKKFYSAGKYSARGQVTLRYKTTTAKVSAGFPQYFYKTVYSSTKTVTVTAAKKNVSPEITSTYTTIGGTRTSSALYNNTTGIRFCAMVRDTDGDSISLKNTGIYVDGTRTFDVITYSQFTSKTGTEKSRGEYNGPRRGSWSTTWNASDGSLSDSATYSRDVRNRAPIITSCSVSPSSGSEEESYTFRATATDADGDSINALRLSITDSSGTRVFPVSSNFRTIDSSYSSGIQKSLTLSGNTSGLGPGSYTAQFYAVDGYDGSTRSSVATASFTISQAVKIAAPEITATYTEIDGERTSQAIYNNTTGIRFCADIRGLDTGVTSSGISVNGSEKYLGMTHDKVNSLTAQQRSRGTYNNPQRGSWSLKWTASNSSGYDSETYSREVRNRAPVITSAYVSPAKIKQKESITIRGTAADADGDDIRQITYRIISESGNTVYGPVTMGSSFPSGQQQQTTMYPELEPGTYIIRLYAYDDYDGSASDPKDAVFTLEKEELPKKLLGTITGAWVFHSEKWDNHRFDFNQYYFGDKNRGDCTIGEYVSERHPRKRGNNVFWSGERFMLKATVSGDRKPDRVSVSIAGTDYRTVLNDNGSSWTGELFDRTMMNRWGLKIPEEITFVFTAYFDEAAVRSVKVIADDTIGYWDLHRKE